MHIVPSITVDSSMDGRHLVCINHIKHPICRSDRYRLFMYVTFIIDIAGCATAFCCVVCFKGHIMMFP